MRTLDDAAAVRRIVESGPRRAVVIGGGYIGLEMAEAFQRNGIATTVVTSAGSVLEPQFDAEMGERVIEAMRGMGIEVRTGLRIMYIEGRDGHAVGVACCEEQSVAREPDEYYEADVVLLGLGSRPEVELARAAGIPLGESGAVWVDDHMRTKVPGVYAAGDCAEALHRVSRRPVNIHLGTIANKQGRIAGINIGGGDEAFPGVLGTAITKVCALEVARTGLTEAEARAAGFDLVAVTFDSTTAAGYWPESQPMTVKAVAERGSRRLLGAQIVGGDSAGKRIDALAMALWNEMTVDEMVNVDLSYAPPFSGVWDPVLVAARKAQAALGG
jgi:NADPH-dependent 2,4-dienoyl-CoA reductase/sulfur reductase-like enzyme